MTGASKPPRSGQWRKFVPICAIAAILTVARAGDGGDPNGANNGAAKSVLPSGPGLAARYPGDAGLKASAQVIFADDFESGNLGDGWDETGNKNGRVMSFTAPGEGTGLGKRCLRVEAHLGVDTGGGLTKWFEPADTVFIRFYTKFDLRCDYVHHLTYITDRWTKHPTNIVFFDSVVIARGYIGPLGTK